MARLAVFLLTLLASHSATGTSLESLISIRDQYLAATKKAGLELGFVPEMKEWTRPSMISWRAEAKAVAIPRWEELSTDHQALVVEMAGSADNAKELFSLLFRWFLIPHELTHAYQDQTPVKMRPSENERFANDVAAAFLNQDREGRDRLANPYRSRARIGDIAVSDSGFLFFTIPVKQRRAVIYGRAFPDRRSK
jgi:hypothetical protein